MLELLKPGERTRSRWTADTGPFILTAVLGSAMTLSVIQSIVRSHWTNFGLPVLVTIAMGGLLVGAIFGRFRWLPGWLAHLLATVLGGCLGDSGDDFQRDKLNEARTRWDGKDVSSYTYILELQCYCAPATQLAPVLVTVQNGSPVSLQYWDEDPSKRKPAPAEIFGPYDTVEELFEFVDETIGKDPQVLQVGYDQDYGFPNVVNVDFKDGGSEQMLFFVTQFKPTTGS